MRGDVAVVLTECAMAPAVTAAYPREALSAEALASGIRVCNSSCVGGRTTHLRSMQIKDTSQIARSVQ